jgi:hypothetical protein
MLCGAGGRSSCCAIQKVRLASLGKVVFTESKAAQRRYRIYQGAGNIVSLLDAIAPFSACVK